MTPKVNYIKNDNVQSEFIFTIPQRFSDFELLIMHHQYKHVLTKEVQIIYNNISLN